MLCSSTCIFNLFLLFLAFPFNGQGKAPDAELPTLFDFLTSSSIITTKLNGPNFLQWSTANKTYVLSRDKLHYIEEDTEEERDARWLKEEMLKSALGCGIVWSRWPLILLVRFFIR